MVVKHRIVVLGAGYAGLACVLDLQDRLDFRRRSLLLVNDSDAHTFTTELPEYAGGADDESAVSIPLRRVLRRPVQLRVERVVGLRAGAGQVECEGGPVPYDLLVVALGSEPDYYGLPGVAEHGLVLWNLRSAGEIRARLEALVGAPGRGEPVAVLVAGGGLTGVELAAEVADRHAGAVSITLVEAGPEIMPGFERPLAEAARRVLEQKGVRVRAGTAIESAGPRSVRLKGGDELRYDLFVWAGGVRANRLVAEAGWPTTHKGRVRVDGRQHPPGYEDVYVVGDCAAFVDPRSGQELPPTAQAAVQSGQAAARSIAARLRGLPEPPFEPRIRGFFASLGRGAGVGQIGEVQLYGAAAYGVKRLIEAHHAWEAGGAYELLRRCCRAVPRFSRRAAPSRPATTPSRLTDGRLPPDPSESARRLVDGREEPRVQ